MLLLVAAAAYLIVDEPTTVFSLFNLYYTAAVIWFMDSLIAFVAEEIRHLHLQRSTGQVVFEAKIALRFHMLPHPISYSTNCFGELAVAPLPPNLLFGVI